jgi:glycosyltransferase involved in cell wall biosynthesis
MDHPLVSVIMPVYNAEKYVVEAIESVLSQTYPNIQLICVDDGSTDTSLQILKDFGDRIVLVEAQQNGGIAKARNLGIACATGDFIAFADADDIWKSTKLSEQMKQFDQDPSLDISFCMIQNFLSPELPDEVKATKRFPTDPIPGQISGAFVAKRSNFDQVGRLSEEYRAGEFIDWMNRAHRLGLRHAMVPEVLYLRRVHATNTTQSRAAQMDYLRIAKAALDWKRNSL